MQVNPLDHVKRAGLQVRLLRASHDELRTAVREAVAAGFRASDVARAAGLTRQRVYQILGKKEER